MSSSTVLKFPVRFSCPTCQRPCGEDELSECLRCGQRYCSNDSWDCQCDLDALDMLNRAQELAVSQLETQESETREMRSYFGDDRGGLS